MTLVSGINHVAILTGDLDRFIRFYSDVFELELLFREATPALQHAILRAGPGCWLHPAHVPDSAHGAGVSQMFARGHLDHIALSAPSEQAFHTIRARLVERGASTGAVEDLGAFHALWFVDPDGMRGELALIVDPQLRAFSRAAPIPVSVHCGPHVEPWGSGHSWSHSCSSHPRLATIGVSMESKASSCGHRGRHRARLVWLPVAAALALAFVGAGCASSGIEFRPYLRDMPHKAMFTRAVIVDRRDVPALAQAGGIIIGHISAHGTGFAGRDMLEENAAVEAARRGGTHLVAEDPRTAAQRETVRLDLSYLVVRLADVQAMGQLSERLQPHRGVHYQSDLVTDPDEVEPVVAPQVLPAAEQQPRASVRIVDGRNLKPLPGSAER